MIKLTAPLSSLTAYIVQDTERLNFGTARMSFPGADLEAPSSVRALTILPPMAPDSIIARLAALAEIGIAQLQEHLAPLDLTQPLFFMAQPQGVSLPACDLYLPTNQFSRVQNAVHRFGPSGEISFPIDITHNATGAAPLPDNKLPNPLSMLFLLEHRIHCQPLIDIEIAVRPAAFGWSPAKIPENFSATLQPCG